ncbi:hypothetical protein OSTOST_00620, partial [Ostertagia ostertagi]
GPASASIRLRGEDEVVLPAGFRFCHKSENAACDHARACMADGTGKTSCVCYPGWSGETCNLPVDIQKANLINVPVCPYSTFQVVPISWKQGGASAIMEHVDSHSVTHRSILIFFLGIFVNCLATEHVLQLRGSSVAPDPPASAVLVSVPVNSSVTLRCEKPSDLPELQWLHNGNDLNLKVLRISEDDKSSLHIAWYITKHHDGVYECYAGPASASIRLRGEDEVVLPAGFRFCHKSENAACDHARACMADGTGKTSCVATAGSGGTCNLPKFEHSEKRTS